jgi:hypothetical protein
VDGTRPCGRADQLAAAFALLVDDDEDEEDELSFDAEELLVVDTDSLAADPLDAALSDDEELERLSVR